MERVRADRHPSVTQMRILEETIPAPLVEEYLVGQPGRRPRRC
jgi:hypothetical protein